MFASEACDGDGEPYDEHATLYARLYELAPAQDAAQGSCRNAER